MIHDIFQHKHLCNTHTHNHSLSHSLTHTLTLTHAILHIVCVYMFINSPCVYIYMYTDCSVLYIAMAHSLNLIWSQVPTSRSDKVCSSHILSYLYIYYIYTFVYTVHVHVHIIHVHQVFLGGLRGGISPPPPENGLPP